MSDSLLNEPYFYLSGYGLNGTEIDYSSMNTLEYGNWIVTENWKGAVLPLSDFNNEPNELINLFLNDAVKWFLK